MLAPTPLPVHPWIPALRDVCAKLEQAIYCPELAGHIDTDQHRTLRRGLAEVRLLVSRLTVASGSAEVR